MDVDSKPFDSLMKEKAQLLLENIEQGNATVQEIIDLNSSRHDALYQQVGRITRGLHDAISNMEFVATPGGDQNHDVQARLGYVIDLTQDAANKTMDLAEEATPIAAELGSASQSLRTDWRRLASRELTAGEFRELYQRIDDFLAYSEDQSNHLHSNLTDIVVTQGYQDLSGQVLQKVVSMLNATENDLVNLLEMAAQMQDANDMSGTTFDPSPIDAKSQPFDQVQENSNAQPKKDLVAEGPLPGGATTLKNQSEVDDLLSNLGF